MITCTIAGISDSCFCDFVQSIPAATAASPSRRVWELFKTPSEERERLTLSNEENKPSRTATILLLKDQQQCRHKEVKVINDLRALPFYFAKCTCVCTTFFISQVFM